MEGLSERIQWILDRTGWSERELSRRAGLKSEAHVGLMRSSGSAKIEAISSIADAAGVRFEWLALGRGEPLDVGRMPEDEFPARASAIAAARLVGVPEHAIRRVQAERRDAGTSADWFARIRAAETLLGPEDDADLRELGAAAARADEVTVPAAAPTGNVVHMPGKRRKPRS